MQVGRLNSVANDADRQATKNRVPRSIESVGGNEKPSPPRRIGDDSTREETMPLFACSKCNCVEETALSHYWSARLRQVAAVCSACDPGIGKWHGEFPRESAQGWVNDRSGFLLDKGEVERWLGQPIETFSRPMRGPDDTRETVRSHVLALDTASYGTNPA
jgi:hypothetical protein